jgi:hypothetical protein
MGDTVIIEDEPKPKPEKEVIVLKPEAKTEKKTVTERTTVVKQTRED